VQSNRKLEEPRTLEALLKKEETVMVAKLGLKASTAEL